MYKYLLIIIVLVVASFLFWQWALVEYNFDVKYGKVDAKGELSVSKTIKGPYVKFTNAKPDKYYSVIIDDPDSPTASNPDDGTWRHLLMTDITGFKLIEGIKNIEGSGKILTPYQGPRPPMYSGPHRYHVRLLEQPGILMDPKVSPDRRNWDIDSFIDDHNLSTVAQKRFTVERKE